MDKFIKYSQLTMMIILTFGTLYITYLALTSFFPFLNFDSSKLGPIVKVEEISEDTTCEIECDDIVKVELIDGTQKVKDETNNADDNAMLESYNRYKIIPQKEGETKVTFNVIRNIGDTDNSDVNDTLIYSKEYNIVVNKVGLSALCANIIEE